MRLNGGLQAEVLLLQVVELDRERLDLVLDVLQLHGRLHDMLLLLSDGLAHRAHNLAARAGRRGSLKEEDSSIVPLVSSRRRDRCISQG